MAYFFGLLAAIGWLWAILALGALTWYVWRKPPAAEVAPEVAPAEGSDATR